MTKEGHGVTPQDMVFDFKEMWMSFIYLFVALFGSFIDCIYYV